MLIASTIFTVLVSLHVCSGAKLISGAKHLSSLILGVNSPIKSSIDGLPKGLNDPRSYRLLTLSNDLQLLLVSDPSCANASAIVQVDVGSYADPEDSDGLAHYVEHLLFLGSAKYTEPGSFVEFVKKAGGSYNGETCDQDTSFYFDIHNDNLAEGVERLSDIFVAPLFLADYAERELTAVDEEYARDKEDPVKRIMFAVKSHYSDGHPITRFGIGNKEILKGKEAAARSFFDRYYSSHRMRGVVIGKADLDDLQATVVPCLSLIPRRPAQSGGWLSSWGSSPSQQIPNVMVHGPPEPALQKRSAFLEILSPSLPETFFLILSLPPDSPEIHFLLHLLNHVQPGGLYDRMVRKEKLAVNLTVSKISSNPGYCQLLFMAELTEKGLSHPELVLSEIEVAFTALSDFPIPARAIGEYLMAVQFRIDYSERHSAKSLAHRMQLLSDPKQFLNFPVSLINPADVMNYCKANLKISRCLFGHTVRGSATDSPNTGNTNTAATIASTATVTTTNTLPILLPKASSNSSSNDWKVEKWLKVSYRLKPVPSDTVVDVPQAYGFPAPSPYLPANLQQLSPSKNPNPVQKPLLLGNGVYLRCDDYYRAMQAELAIILSSSAWEQEIKNASARFRAVTFVINRIISEKLTSINGELEPWGSNISILIDLNSLVIRVSGFPGQFVEIANIVNKVLLELQNVGIGEEEFPKIYRIVEAEIKGWVETDNSFDCGLLTSTISSGLYPAPHEVAQAIATAPITLAECKAALSGFKSQTCSVETIGVGNIGGAELKATASIFQQSYLSPSTGDQKSQRMSHPTFQLTSSQTVLSLPSHVTLPNKETRQVVYAIKMGSAIDALVKIRSRLAVRLLSAPFFTALRTEREAGYSVQLTRGLFGDSYYLLFFVQSAKLSHSDIESLIRGFLGSATALIDKEGFLEVRSSHADALRQPFDNCHSEMGDYLQRVLSKFYDFDGVEEQLSVIGKNLMEVRAGPFIKWVAATLIPEGPEHKAIIVNI